jgi:voltage-gated potassium channel
MLEPQPDDTPLEKVINVAMMALILANVFAVVMETEPAVFAAYPRAFAAFEVFSVGCFMVEYGLRVWTSVEDPRHAGSRTPRLRYMASPMAIIDVLAILPSLLALTALDLRFLRILRIFRVFSLLKMARYSQSVRLLGRVFLNRKEELVVTFGLGAMMLLMASSLMYFLEHEAQPKAFGSIPSAMWWGVVTLATVGYGDVFPVTMAGRAFGGFVALIGVGLFALPAGIIATGFHEELRAAREGRPCPHCHMDPNAPPVLEKVVPGEARAEDAYL